jgi:molybdate transport system substrate-binding protein
MPNRRALLAALALAPLFGLALPPAPVFAADPIVFAAASLQDALNDVAMRYKAMTGKTVTISYGASSTLARQIEQGAPADIFFSADLGWMDDLQMKSEIQDDSRLSLLGNKLVLVAPKASTTASVTIAKGMDFVALLGKDGKLAMANVTSVPAGLYGKASLDSLGLWNSVAARVVQADNVRSALAFVAQGEAPLGIVYATDASAEPAVKVVGAFPDDSHPPIIYPVALTKTSTSPDARAFFDFLKSDAAKPAYVMQGFTVLAPAP